MACEADAHPVWLRCCYMLKLGCVLCLCRPASAPAIRHRTPGRLTANRSGPCARSPGSRGAVGEKTAQGSSWEDRRDCLSAIGGPTLRRRWRSTCPSSSSGEQRFTRSPSSAFDVERSSLDLPREPSRTLRLSRVRQRLQGVRDTSTFTFTDPQRWLCVA